MAKNYVAMRFVSKADGTMSIPYQTYEDRASAEKEFYRLCMLAVDSENPMDAVMLISKDGMMVDRKVFVHDVPAPAPEPEPEPETVEES